MRMHGLWWKILLLLVLVGGGVFSALHWKGLHPSTAATKGQTELIQVQYAPGTGDTIDSLIREANKYLGQPDCSGAVPFLERVLLVRPDPNNEFTLGKCLMQAKRPADAKKRFEKAKAAGVTGDDLESWLKRATDLSKEDSGMAQVESAHFHLWVEGKASTWNAADTLLPALEKVYDRMTVTWNHYPKDKVPAVFYQSDQFRTRDLPDWTGALFDGKVRIPYNVLDKWPAKEQILTHEVAHAFVHDIAGVNIPTWLDEGIAQQLDGTAWDPAKLAALKLPPFTLLSGDFISHSDATEADRLYCTALGMFRILLRDGAHGDIGQVKDLLLSLREGVPFAEQLKNRMGLTTEDIFKKLGDELPPAPVAPASSSSPAPTSTQSSGA